MIEVSHIYKSFADKQVLNDVSVKFEAGKTNLIIGQSGSGKTVLMKSLVGLYQVDKGSIFYNNRDFAKMNTIQRKALRKEMGMLFQGSALFDSMTVEENVMFPLSMFTDQPEDEQLDRVNFCLKRVNLDNVNHLYPSEISGGMQKRVAIARAIALNPKYLFCDEPNSGLDPKTSIIIDRLISEITQEYNITTVINTHDMNSVLEIGDNVVFINKGEKWWQGTKDEILYAENKELEDFIYSSAITKRLRTKL